MSWRRFWQRKRRDEDLARELESYLAHEEHEKVNTGMSPEEARSAALRKLGNVTSIREEVYRMNTMGFIDVLWQDVRYALRTLYRTPIFSLAAILTLALGIGANTAIFSVVRSVLLKPLPYGNPERIMVLEPFDKNAGKTGTVVSAPDFHDWRSQNQVFESMAYHAGQEVTAIVNGVPTFVNAQAVTPDFFAVFGLPPAAGRFWSEQENTTPLAVVSHSWAQGQFGDLRAWIGKTIRVHGKAVEVIGVALPGFRYPGASDVWISAGLFPENSHRSGHNYFAIGKLKPGISLNEARSEMRAIGDRLEQQYKENRFKTVAVTPLTERLTRSSKTTLWVLLGAVFGVLLIACVNVANLQMSRAASRSREMAVRAALGASRIRILRQLFTENVVLGGLGAGLGLGLASLLLKALLTIAPTGIPRLDEGRLDSSVLLFALVLAVVCSILFGLAPARRSSDPDLNSGLRQGKGSIGRVTGRTRAVLVGAEVALSVILLAGAGLLLRSFVALTRVDLGFSTDRLLLTSSSIAVANEDEARRATEFQRDLIEKIGVLPGVHKAAGVRTIPFAERRSTAQYWIEGGRLYRPGEAPNAQMQVVTPEYFETIGMAIRRGRDFTSGDSWGRPQVAIINETLARDAFGKENPLGQRIRCGMSSQSVKGMEIVGVVKDARQIAPGESARPELFMPYLQHPFPGSNLTLIIQTRLEPYALSTAIRQTVRSINPEAPVRFSTMDEVARESLAFPRFRAALTGCFAVLAACLAIVGVYSVTSYLVSQRTSEIGLRFALGARPMDVFRFVIGESMRLVIAGLALGLTGTLALSRVLQTLLFGISPHDPLTIAAVLGALGLAALVGSTIPAIRAARVDPLVTLRQE